MKRLSLSLISLGLAVISFNTYAAMSNSDAYNQHQGLYLEGTAGTNLAISDGSDWGGYGLTAALGYQFTPILGLEAGYIRNGVADDLALNSGYVAARLTAPIGSRFSLFGKVGGIYSHASVSHDLEDDIGGKVDGGVFSPLVGGGVAYSVTSQLDVNAQIQGLIHNDVFIGVVGGGFTYHV